MYKELYEINRYSPVESDDEIQPLEASWLIIVEDGEDVKTFCCRKFGWTDFKDTHERLIRCCPENADGEGLTNQEIWETCCDEYLKEVVQPETPNSWYIKLPLDTRILAFL